MSTFLCKYPYCYPFLLFSNDQELYLNDIRESEFLSDKRKSKIFFSCRASNLDQLACRWAETRDISTYFFGPLRLPIQIVGWHILITQLHVIKISTQPMVLQTLADV